MSEQVGTVVSVVVRLDPTHVSAIAVSEAAELEGHDMTTVRHGC
jgi:hypothetical protein